MKNHFHRSRGFTLVELLVAIIVTGILSALSISSFVELKQKVYDAVARSKVRDMGVACTALMSDFEVDPIAAATEHNFLNSLSYNPVRLNAMIGCYGEACAPHFPALSVSKNVITGYVISGYNNTYLETDKETITFSASSSNNRGFIDCIAVAYHKNGSNVYYWIPRLGLYTTTNPNPTLY